VTEPERTRWLLLIHQLPKDPAYLRVKIGRRLARIGAVPLKSSVYVLPRSESAVEDFQWVRQEVVTGGGEATIADAALVDGLSDEEVEAKFREARDADYAELAREARELGKTFKTRSDRRLSDDRLKQLLEGVARLEQRMHAIMAMDFFGASLREAAGGLLQELRARAETPQLEARAPTGRREQLRGRTWVTRTGIHVDRIGSAWLIRRLIDPDARFKYVPPKGYVPLEGELRFDMFDAEYSHEGDRCTFETLLERFDLRGVAGLVALAEVVHDIDLKETKFDRPETAGFAACLVGLCRRHRDDAERLAQGGELFEDLLAYYAAQKERSGS
jgi:hypothetical protein